MRRGRAVAWSLWLAAILLCGAADTQRRRPSLSGQNAASKDSSSEESLGSQLLTAVLSDDLEAAAAIFKSVSASQAVRLSNAIDWRGKSVLMHASSRNHAEMAKLLIDQKARVDAADYTGGATALMLAARNGSLAAVTTLIDAGAKVSAASPQGMTVLMQGVANGSAPIVAQLLGAGADPLPREKGGASALSLAASTGNAQVVRLLAAAGADLNSADSQGRPAECLAAQTFTHMPRLPDEGHMRCVQGSTALLVAAASGQLEVRAAPAPLAPRL